MIRFYSWKELKQFESMWLGAISGLFGVILTTYTTISAMNPMFVATIPLFIPHLAAWGMIIFGVIGYFSRTIKHEKLEQQIHVPENLSSNNH